MHGFAHAPVPGDCTHRPPDVQPPVSVGASYVHAAVLFDHDVAGRFFDGVDANASDEPWALNTSPRRPSSAPPL